MKTRKTTKNSYGVHNHSYSWYNERMRVNGSEKHDTPFPLTLPSPYKTPDKNVEKIPEQWLVELMVGVV